MYSSSSLPWPKIHEFLLDIGEIRDPKEFCVRVTKRIHRLIPYDQARVYFVSDTGRICDEFLLGVEQRWSDLYREYFSRMDNGRYAISNAGYWSPSRKEKGRHSIPKIVGSVYDWADCECDEFIANYIRPQRLKHSAGFALYNTAGFANSICCFDRTSHSGYTRREMDMMSIVQPHLDNLHRNLFVLASSNTPVRNPEARQLLTRRESEIAEFLCRGLTPAKISQHLCLSLSTVNRHIANMHEKLDVSNRQELLLKLMDYARP